MNGPCGRAGEYVGELLSPEEEQRFLAHLTGCAACQLDLEDEVQLRGVEDEARVAAVSLVAASGAGAADSARVVSIDAAKSRARTAAPASTRGEPRTSTRASVWRQRALGIGAAAAAGLVAVWSLKDAPRDEAAVWTLAAERGIEGRFSLAAADHYRPHAALRGPAPAKEIVSAETIAAFERRGDVQAVATAYALAGDRNHAAEYLARAPASADVESDRGLLAALDGRLDEALQILDAVLRGAPDHRQALWNRGLVLRDLELPLAAAASFARVAELDPEWRAEATARAEALRGDTIALRDAWWAMYRAGQAMISGGPPIAVEEARRFPGRSRQYFHEAVRLADSAERLDALKPLAAELDKAHKTAALSAEIEAALSRNFAGRAPLLEQYRALALGQGVNDEKTSEKWLSQARRAGADDLIAGAVVLAKRSADHLDELKKWSAGSRWSALIFAAEEAKAAASKDGSRARAILDAALERCDEPYRCTLLEIERTKLFFAEHRIPEARASALAALERARRGNEWSLITWLYGQLGDAERLRSRFAAARAYYEETALSVGPDRCAPARDNRLVLADLYVLEGRPEDAAREARAAPECPTPLTIAGLFVHVDLHRLGMPVLPLQKLEEAIEALRAQRGLSAAERLYADFAAARLAIDRDPAGAEVALRALIAEGRKDPSEVAAVKTRVHAFTMLIADAAKRGDFSRMVPLFLEAAGVTAAAPRACFVALAQDDLRLAAVAAGPDGAIVGHYQERAPAPFFGFVPPPAIVRAVEGCAAVQVLAQPPLYGSPQVLPPQVAWSYHLPRAEPAAKRGVLPERRVIVAGSTPPRSLGMPVLAAEVPAGGAETLLLRGAEATPARVLAEIDAATEIQFHVHAVSDLSRSDAPILALSPGEDGVWALDAEAIAARSLSAAPLVLLADCRAAEMADYLHRAWGLPTAFLSAGAVAVVAPPADVPDREAALFFAEISRRVREGETAAVAAAAARRDWIARDPSTWAAKVMVFD